MEKFGKFVHLNARLSIWVRDQGGYYAEKCHFYFNFQLLQFKNRPDKK